VNKFFEIISFKYLIRGHEQAVMLKSMMEWNPLFM